jgi:hypothetical protein
LKMFIMNDTVINKIQLITTPVNPSFKIKLKMMEPATEIKMVMIDVCAIIFENPKLIMNPLRIALIPAMKIKGSFRKIKS